VGEYLSELQAQGEDILFEGAQATLLDIAHGTYPFVTSSHPTLGGVIIGTGFRPRNLQVLGVAKAYTTRVGAGPFPTELEDETGEQLRSVGREYGTTTGRPRRCGWLDLTILRYAHRVNGLDALALTKLDVLTGIRPLRVAIGYRLGRQVVASFTTHERDLEQIEVVYEEYEGWDEDITAVERFQDLPEAARRYVRHVEEGVDLPVTMVSVGPGRTQLIAGPERD
jgi:adenylosuccinate synthase